MGGTARKRKRKSKRVGGRGSASRKAARGRLSRRLSPGSMMARARAKLERINPRRRRCLIEPPAGLEGIIVHVRECSRYGTGAIVPGTRTCARYRDILYSRDTCNKLFRSPPSPFLHLLPTSSSPPENPFSQTPFSRSVGCVRAADPSCGRGILEDECPTTGLCGFSRHS